MEGYFGTIKEYWVAIYIDVYGDTHSNTFNNVWELCEFIRKNENTIMQYNIQKYNIDTVDEVVELIINKDEK